MVTEWVRSDVKEKKGVYILYGNQFSMFFFLCGVEMYMHPPSRLINGRIIYQCKVRNKPNWSV